MEIPTESSENTDANDAGKGIGFFIEGTNDLKREYTIWVDQQDLWTYECAKIRKQSMTMSS